MGVLRASYLAILISYLNLKIYLRMLRELQEIEFPTADFHLKAPYP